MAWRVEWHEPAAESLRRIHWLDAARVDAAVQRFAATGEGNVVRLATDGPTTLRLRAGPHVARLTLDRIDGVIWVWIVYRLR